MFETQTQAAQSAVNDLAQAAEQKVSDQQNALDTAALAIADLQKKYNDDEQQITELLAIEDSNTASIMKLTTQLATLQSTVTYPDLEWNDWHDNDGAVVGGSGLGKSSELEPDGSGWATFSITPNQPAPNYYDSYFNKRYSPQPQAKNFELRNTWRFDTSADAAACQCLEMEARQVVNGLMIVVALQLDFSENTLRFWDAVKKWQPSGKPMPRFASSHPYEVILAGHRDDVSVYHDSITINGIKTDLTGTSYQAQPTNWGQMIRPALQLDGEKAALAYKVRYQKAQLKVW